MATLSHDCHMMYVCVVETRTWTVNAHPTDTLTEGGVARGGSGSTCTVHVLPQLLCLTRIL